MAETHHPHRGSLGYSPRKRASSPVPKIKSWPQVEETKMLGFSGYKAGMTQVVIRDDHRYSISSGEEVTKASTIIEAPPALLFGIRLYGRDTQGLRPIADSWRFSKVLARVMPKSQKRGKLKELEGRLEEAEEVRVLVHTQPSRTGIGQKKPEIMEYKVSGSREEALNYAKENLGKEIRVGDIFKAGDYIDVLSITKGKGFQSPIRKWGTKHLPRKTRKGRRTAGNLGPWHPSAMMWTVPQSGQMGYHHRTEYNKRILKIASAEEEGITPRGGFLDYGEVRNDYLIVQGSIPGPKKRLVRFRPALRAKRKPLEPTITHINLESKQGG